MRSFVISKEGIAVFPILVVCFGKGFRQGLMCLMVRGHLFTLNSTLVSGRRDTQLPSSSSYKDGDRVK